MLLLRQLQAGSMAMSVPSIPFLTERLPSYTSILLSLLASLVVLSLVRAAVLCVRSSLGKKTQQPPVQVQAEEKSIERSHAAPPRSSWRILFTWESVSSSLPVTLSPIDKGSMGKGVGMQQKREQRPADRWQPQPVRRSGPTFETPLPALYQSEEPLSMAKMIMSRHTHRRPNRPPAPRVTARVAISSPRKSMPAPSPPSQPSSPPPSNPPSMV